MLQLDRGIDSCRNRQRTERPVSTFPRYRGVDLGTIRSRSWQYGKDDVGMVGCPIEASTVPEVVGPRAAQRLRQFTRQKHLGQGTVVVEITCAVGGKDAGYI